ncbi:phage tail protein [Bacillus pseudomycoides]|nr:phage tail protein [Bacillus pseudomycoides]
MIRESLYFMFAGRRSSEFGLYNVSISQGLYEEPLMHERNIKEFTIAGEDKPYFQRIERQPLSFNVSFYFDEGWNDELMNEVLMWLDVDYYQPLQFQSNLNRIYYAMPTTGLSLIHNGLKQGRLTITFRCDSSYAYSPQITTPWYDASTTSPLTFQLENKGVEIYPEIDIVKVGDGDVSIVSYTNGGNEFKFTGLKNTEEIYVHCDNEIIESSMFANRYDNFNDNYLSLKYGLNTFKLTGKCKIRFSYSYKLL